MKHSFIEHVIVVLFAESHKFHVPNGLRLNDFWSLVKWNIMKTVYLTKIEEKEKTGTFKQIMFQISHIPMSSSVSSLSIFVVVCFMPFTTNEQWINWYLNKMKLNCLKKIMCVIFRFDFGDFSQYKRVKFDIDWSINQLIFPKMFVAFMVVGNIVEFPYQIDIFCDGSMVFQCVLGWHNTYYHWRWLRHMMLFPQNWSVFHIGSMGVISSIDWICVVHSRSRFQYIYPSNLLPSLHSTNQHTYIVWAALWHPAENKKTWIWLWFSVSKVRPITVTRCEDFNINFPMYNKNYNSRRYSKLKMEHVSASFLLGLVCVRCFGCTFNCVYVSCFSCSHIACFVYFFRLPTIYPFTRPKLHNHNWAKLRELGSLWMLVKQRKKRLQKCIVYAHQFWAENQSCRSYCAHNIVENSKPTAKSQIKLIANGKWQLLLHTTHIIAVFTFE